MDSTSKTDNSQAFLDRLLEEGIKPQAGALAKAHVAGEVGLVFFDIDAGSPAAVAAARRLGWRRGRCECKPMSRARAEKLADTLPSADPCSKWLRGRRPGRIFVLTRSGTFCVNFQPELGFSFEAGTLDREWKD